MLRKIGLSMVAAVVLMGVMVVDAQAQPLLSKHFSPEFQNAALGATVRIKATNGKETWQGSGVCVKYFEDSGVAIILTAAHCAKDAKQMEFEVFTSESFPNPAKVYKNAEWKAWSSRTDDVGIIVAKMWVPYAYPLAKNDDLEKGDPVLSVGCGKGAPPGCQVARFAGLDDAGNYEVDAGSIFGRSGGPLFSRRGVIGVCSKGGEDVTLYVSLEKIHDLFKRVTEELKAQE